jgi:hypothetical protein
MIFFNFVGYTPEFKLNPLVIIYADALLGIIEI